MQVKFLKQAEIFSFIAAILLVNVIFMEKQRKENPPIIILSESEARFRFAFGSATIPEFFDHALKSSILPMLDSLSQAYDCDAIEVVGHTDSAPMIPVYSNLDIHLASYFREGRIDSLAPGSNLDLGMMRALAIIRLLRRSQAQDSLLAGIKYFFPYSAGQMIRLDRSLITADTDARDAARRRIEIRLLNSTRRHMAKTWAKPKQFTRKNP